MKELDKKVITNLNIVKKFHKAPLVEALKKVEIREPDGIICTRLMPHAQIRCFMLPARKRK